MKAKPLLYSLMLIVWMGGSTYWYVCKIKHDCPEPEKTEDTPMYRIAQKSQDDIDLEVKKVDSHEDSIKIKEKAAKRLEKKLAAGYIISDFPTNAPENNQIENDFDEFIKDLKQYVSKNKEAIIELTGNTDNIGNEQANLILGKKRAAFIKNKLVGIGIPEQNIVLHTKGESEPVQTNTTVAGRTKNRRVEIKLLKK